MARSAVVATALAGVVLAGALAGCVPTTPTPVPSQAAPSSTSTPAPTAPVDPVFVEGGTAEENKPYFDKVNLAFFASSGTGTSLGIANNLVAAGFRKQDLEVTADHTSIDLAADSTIVSVRLKGECLIGDFQASGYKSIVAPLLGTGGCLIGTTVPIP